MQWLPRPSERTADGWEHFASPRQKHLIFDEDTCTKVEVEMPLAIALLEVLCQDPSVLAWLHNGLGLDMSESFNSELRFIRLQS